MGSDKVWAFILVHIGRNASVVAAPARTNLCSPRVQLQGVQLQISYRSWGACMFFCPFLASYPRSTEMIHVGICEWPPPRCHSAFRKRSRCGHLPATFHTPFDRSFYSLSPAQDGKSFSLASTPPQTFVAQADQRNDFHLSRSKPWHQNSHGRRSV